MIALRKVRETAPGKETAWTQGQTYSFFVALGLRSGPEAVNELFQANSDPQVGHEPGVDHPKARYTLQILQLCRSWLWLQTGYS